MGKKILFFYLFIFIVHCTWKIENCMCQWQTDVRITNNSYLSETCVNNARCIAISGDTLHITWLDTRDGNYEIYYNRSTNGGTTWGTDTRLTNNTGYSIHSCIAVSGSNVHIAWHDFRDGNYEIYYKRSTDGGTTWGSDVRLTNNSSDSRYACIAVSGSNVYVVWQDLRDGNGEVYYKYSSDGGTTWGTDTRLTNATGDSVYPSLGISGSTIHLAWHDTRNGLPNIEIYYKRSTDGGLTWSSDVRLTNDAAQSWYPALAVSGQTVSVVWDDARDGNQEIYYKRSTDDGITWSSDTRLTNATGISEFCNIAVSGSIIHATWNDTRDGGAREIYYKRSTNSGTSWETDIRLTNSTGESSRTSLATYGSAVHLIWNDNRDGNYEVYYKRNPIGNSITITYNRNNINKIIGPNQNVYDTINAISLKYNPISTVNNVILRIDTVIFTPDNQLEYTLIHQSIYDTVIFHAGGSGSNFIETILSDSASISIMSGSPPFTGIFKPQRPLSQFNGLDVNGLWILRIYNNGANYKSGVIKSWGITITYNLPIGIRQTSNTIPSEIKLMQNYPNPFNPMTNVKWSILNEENVKIVVCDILGKEVAILINEKLKAGEYEVTFDGSDLSSGIYFYKLGTGNFSEVKKMILIK
jgi:hypothetical protein